MNLEEKIKIIEEKISNLPQEFDEEESFIIDNNPRLIKLIHDTILGNLELCNEQVLFSLSDIVAESLIRKHGQVVFTNYIYNTLNQKIISLEELHNYISQEEFELANEDIERFEQIIHEGFLNRDLPVERFNKSEETIKAMMQYERYDLISQINNCFLSDDYCEEFWNSYPFDKYPFPPFLGNNEYLANKHLEDYPLEYALIAYTRIIDGATRNDEEFIEILPTYANIILEKLSRVDHIDLSIFKDSNEYFQNLVPLYYLEERIDQKIIDKINAIAILLFKNGLYEIMKQLHYKKMISLEEVREVLIKAIKSCDYKLLENIGFVNFVYSFNNDFELLDILLENGFVEEAFLLSYEIVSEEKMEYIIEQLSQKNEKYRKYAKIISYPCDYSIEENTINAKLESGFVEEIRIRGLNYSLNPEQLEFLNELLIKYPNIKVSCYRLDKNHFLTILPALKQTSRLETIVEYLKETQEDQFPELIEIIDNDDLISNYVRKNFRQGLSLFKNNDKGVISTPNLLKVYFENDVYTHEILDYINHHEELESFYTDENYQLVKNYLSKTYNISFEYLDLLESSFGPLLIRYIDNENIQLLATLPLEELNKIIALFPKETYTLQELAGAYDSLKQYEFGKKYSKEVQIFPALLHAIEDGNTELVNHLVITIAKELDETFIKRFLKKYELSEDFTKGDLTNLVRLVVEKIKICTGDKLEKYHTILHEMTDYYISKKREQYRDTYNMEEELSIPYELEEKSLERALINFIIIKSPDIRTSIENEQATKKGEKVDWGWGPTYKTIYFNFKELLIYELEKQGISHEVAIETLEYYITKDKEKCKLFKEVKTTIPKLIRITRDILVKILSSNHIYEFGIDSLMIDQYIDELDSRKEVKRIYKLEEKRDVFEILSQLNIEVLRKDVLVNDEVYSSLLRTMKKRKLHLLPKSISKILGTKYINISKDLTNIAGFISYYGTIFDNVKRNLEANGKSSNDILLNITNILIYAEVYSGLSSVYSQILGSEDAKLIKANPGPNAASRKLANEGRLKEAVERTIKLYERREITIPSFEEDVILESGKKMHVVVGNFTHASNLTHGERTGACMRIGGVGESLFEFALDNPNGFHIRFENPQNREYISRVTGFRNGNTVFLNELRDSCNKNKYSNEDVIESCKKVAELLIELSKSSTCPIENVVVHKAYATSEMTDPMVDLGVKDIKVGLPKFYSDVSSSAIVLSTTSKQDKFVPLNFDKTNIPIYQPVREKPRVAKTLQEASNRINRVNSVKRMLAGDNYEYIEPYKFPNGLIYAITTDDWYIYIDEDGHIIKDIIDLDPRAKDELAEVLIEVENNISKIISENQEVKYGL